MNVFAFVAACLSGYHAAHAATCTEVNLPGAFAPRRLMKCVGGLDIYKITDPNSCPDGWKLWAPESRDDWDTVIRSGALPVGNPHFIVDVTKPSSGCSGCRNTMNSNEPSVSEWKTSNGEPWFLRASGYSEPSGDYDANCFLSISSWSNPDDIRMNDASCNIHSTDYLCQPIIKEDCTNRTEETSGPCANENAIFRSSNCTSGVCEQGKYLLYKSKTKIDECRRYCEEGRNYTMVPGGITEKIYSFRQNGQFHDVTSMTPDLVRVINSIDYPSTSNPIPGTNFRDHYYLRFEGKVKVQTGGNYEFYTQSDDGSRLYINGVRLVNNGGWHGMRTRSGSVDLAAGLHDFVAESFEGGGGAGMIAHWKGPDTGDIKTKLTSSAFETTPTYVLPGLFNQAGPCAAYSYTADKQCLLYTECQGVGSSSSSSEGLDFLSGTLDQFKTCKFPAVTNPSEAAAFF